MKNNHFHTSFQLNGTSFTTKEEILGIAQSISDSLYKFLNEWFSEGDYIEVATSGSTGKPKSIQLKKAHMHNSALATGNYFSMLENTKALCCLPVQYIAGKMMLVRALTLGWDLEVVTPTSTPLEGNLKSYDFVAMVPMQVQNSLSQLEQIDTLIIGGGAVSEPLLTQLQDVNVKTYATYGMTETITHIAIKPLSLRAMTERSRSHAKQSYEVLPNITISQDSRGCLVIEAPSVSDSIVVTNDMVDLSSETEFKWKGRYDNVINSGGVKLHPEVIERKLSKILSQRFFVTGIPDEQLGEKLVLIVERSESTVTLSAVERSLKTISTLSKYEIPKAIYFVAKFVETETKKIQRQQTLDLIF